MATGYFHRVSRETPTRLWINNPTSDDLEQAMGAGAINCTTNPAYGSVLLQREPATIRGVIEDVVSGVEDDNVAADVVYQKVALRVMERLQPLHEASGGRQGFVTIQADPREDEDTDLIVQAALRHRELGPNYMAKIPVIASGIKAIEAIIPEGIAICATEVFSIAQAACVCDLYDRVAKACGTYPPFYVTHISGIFDEYLAGVVKDDGIDIAPDVLWHAGCAVARKEYRMLKDRAYHTTMLGGGARGIHHFTEMVGGDVHITINWSTAEELIQADKDVTDRMEWTPSKELIAELLGKLPDVRSAYVENGLAVEEFGAFGPVQLFRNKFLNGYGRLLSEIATCRAALERA